VPRPRQTAERADGHRSCSTPSSSGDAFAYTPHPDPSAHAYEVIRGARPRWAHHDPRPCLVPPDWSGGYTSIFAAQAGEERTAAE
jgi:ectoine hydroxylase